MFYVWPFLIIPPTAMLSRVLLVGANTTYATLLRYRLESKRSIRLHQVDTGAEAIEAFNKATTLALVAPDLPDGNGLDLVESLRAGWRNVPILLMVRPDEADAARAALSHGATDVLVAGSSDLDRMEWWVEQARRNTATVAPPVDIPCDLTLAGDSLAIRRTRSRIRQAQHTDAPVLLAAESGLEPDTWAQRLHAGSLRADGPFVAVDGAVMSDAAVSDALFGSSDAPGASSEAAHGTLFVDNIGLLSREIQEALFTMVDTGTIPAHKDRSASPFQARLICGTGRDLEALARTDALHPDLHDLLTQHAIPLPPLRERTEDLLLLAQRLLREKTADTDAGPLSFSVPAMRRLMAYDWPGNHRELASAIEQGIRTAQGLEVTADDLFPDEDSLPDTDAFASSISTTDFFSTGSNADPQASDLDSPDSSHSDAEDRAPAQSAAEAETTRAPRSLFDLKASDVAALDPPSPSSAPDVSSKKTPLEQVAVQAPDAIIPLEELHVLAIEHALHVCDGDIKQAARALGVPSSTVSHVASQLVSSVATLP